MVNDLSQVLPHKKLKIYSKFNLQFELEKYLIILKNVNERSNLTSLRISAHNLNIEKGRHKKPLKVPLDDRICALYLEFEDRFHYVLNG